MTTLQDLEKARRREDEARTEYENAKKAESAYYAAKRHTQDVARELQAEVLAQFPPQVWVYDHFDAPDDTAYRSEVRWDGSGWVCEYTNVDREAFYNEDDYLDELEWSTNLTREQAELRADQANMKPLVDAAVLADYHESVAQVNSLRYALTKAETSVKSSLADMKERGLSPEDT